MHDHLPGGEILRDGLRDLSNGTSSVAAMLVLIAGPRLAGHGFPIPRTAATPVVPEHELYRLLAAEHGPEAYRHYRSLLRRLVSLENALDAQAAG